jgi:hypothetical protein
MTHDTATRRTSGGKRGEVSQTLGGGFEAEGREVVVGRHGAATHIETRSELGHRLARALGSPLLVDRIRSAVSHHHHRRSEAKPRTSSAQWSRARPQL